ncbi:hypothetical protein N836_35835 [Leptolyngbya sp. Heron Island J]|nr:hypothetical protein N836_35835 [Leptolyngbya sp. Heron Island J]
MTQEKLKPTFNRSIKLDVARLIFPEFDIDRALIDGKPCYMARFYDLRWEMTDESLTKLVIKIIARLVEVAKLHAPISKDG